MSWDTKAATRAIGVIGANAVGSWYIWARTSDFVWVPSPDQHAVSEAREIEPTMATKVVA